MRLTPFFLLSSLFALACAGGSSTKTGSDVTSDVDGDGDGFSEDDGDCDDADEDINPDASERCDDLDNDCDGNVDEGNTCGGGGGNDTGGGTTDTGGGSGSTAADDDNDGYSEDEGDCNDRSTAVNPGARETCNGRDDNCDGSIDEGGVCGDTGGGGGGGGGGSDTGLAAVFFTGTFNATSRSLTSADFGQVFYGLRSGSLVCDFRGEMPYEGPATGCPDCTWSFDLGPITGSDTVAGDCGAVALSAGAYDGYFDYSWGLARSFDFYGDGSIIVEDTVTLQYAGEWIPFAFNASAYGITQVYTSGSTTDVLRQASDYYGSPQYAYYYL